MKRLYIIVCFALMAAGLQATTTPQTLINEANNLYAKNDFQGAIKDYLEVLHSGITTAGIYYNLGNAYYKTRDLKNAILYYERAKLLDPGDNDIENNLELARSQTFDKIETIPGIFFMTWLRWLETRLMMDTWAYLSVVSFIIGLLMFLFYLLTRTILVKKISFWLGAVFLLFSISSFSFSYELNKAQNAHDHAIIFSPTVIVKSSPSDTGTNLFIIHEGTKVKILDKVGNWNEIKIADGNRGWIMDSDMQVI